MAPNLFASNFATNPTLDGKGHLLPDFNRFTKHKPTDIFVTARKVSRLMKSLEPNKATRSDKIPLIVVKSINPELSLILSKLFNSCLKENSFPSVLIFSSV